MKKILLVAALCVSIGSFAQVTDTTAKSFIAPEWLKRFKVSGYLQAQYQLADSAGQRSYNGGNFQPGVDQRFMVRRGRIKFQHDGKLNEKNISTSQYVIQLDVIEKGVNIKDAYVRFTDPWTGWFSVTTGMQNRPFGYEIIFSSSMRESPERGRMSQIIFPNERDLGAMLTVHGSKKSGWDKLKLEAGFFNGNGAPGTMQDATDFDKFKDFMGHIVAAGSLTSKIKLSGGVSYYYGGYRVDSVNVYKTEGSRNILKSAAADNYKSGILADRNKATRQYIGADVQAGFMWAPGLTTIRVEYIQGMQPGISSGSTSPIAPVNSDIYERQFNGAYIYFVQNIMKSPLQAFVKYDWYDPNTDVKGNNIGLAAGTGERPLNAGDIRFDTWGFGLIYHWDENLKITGYYELITNETSANLSGYTKDLKDNLFTLRAQYKF